MIPLQLTRTAHQVSSLHDVVHRSEGAIHQARLANLREVVVFNEGH